MQPNQKCCFKNEKDGWIKKKKTKIKQNKNYGALNYKNRNGTILFHNVISSLLKN